MSRLALHLLGPPHIERDGAPITIRRRKAVALLAYLVMTRRSHSRDALATLFWPEADQSQARAGLRRALAALKKALGEGWLDADRETVDLNPKADPSAGPWSFGPGTKGSGQALWLDVSEFHDRLAECRMHGHPPDQDCPACLPLLAEAAALYRDDFLAGFTLRDSPAFDEWQFFQTQGLRDDLAGALERLARGHSVQGEFEQAIPYARRWLALDPLQESAHRCLMQMYAQSGQRAAALRQYAECERILQEELGVPPQEETAHLFQAVKEGRERAAEDSQPERYRFERKISSKGSFGEVWLATDTRLDRPVAVKCPKVAHDPSQREQFVAEARMLARLNHPNITQIHDALFDEGKERFYLVMEYVDGKDLADILSGGTPLPLDWVLEVAMGILRALSYAHGQGLVHRDVKPDNVMVADDVKLTDFGLADLKSILQRGSRYMAGTPTYMAPEQIEGRAVDGRTDLYALGVMLFEMITLGHLPFDYTDEDEMLEAHLHAAPPPVSQFAPTVPSALEQAITRLLAKDPEERYPSAEAVMEVLGSISVEPKLSNLPVSLTPFVGREAVLAGIAGLLDDPACRLLTLVGPGGCGKTRLAVKAADAQLDRYPHGVYFVSLAPLQSVDAIVPTVAEALGYSLYEGIEPQQQLLNYLHQKSALIILDNFEHLLDGVELVPEILRIAPGVKIVATSRVRLNVQVEHLFPVAGMNVPESPPETATDASRYSAVKLFLTSARRAQPDFELTSDDLTDVVRICQLVEGMPLAIELAATWMEVLTPAEIAAEIGQGLDFLETDLHDVPERQRSLRAVFDHSWNLLTERERELVQGLSVFRGGFTRRAIQQVTGASLRELTVLVHKSLLNRTSTGRYHMQHELLRQYAAEKLDQTPAAGKTAHNRHCAYYATALQRRADEIAAWYSDYLHATLAEMDVEIDNARAAWNWAAEQGLVERLDQAMEGLCRFYDSRLRYEEGEVACRTAVEKLTASTAGNGLRVLAKVLTWQGYFNRKLGHTELTSQLLKQSLALLQAPVLTDQDTRPEQARALLQLGHIVSWADYKEAMRLYEQGLALYRALGSQDGTASATDFLRSLARTLDATGEAKQLLGKFAEAHSLLEESAPIYNNLKFGDRMAFSNISLGSVEVHLGRYEQARARGQTGLTLFQEIGHRQGIGYSCSLLGEVALAGEAYAEAHGLLQESIAVFQEIEQLAELSEALAVLGIAAQRLGQLSWAQQHFSEALWTAAEIEAFIPLLYVLPAVALLLADQGEKERAVEVYALASRYPFVANSRWFEDVVGKHIAAIAAALPPDVIAAAQQRGRARDLDATLAELLAELEGKQTVQDVVRQQVSESAGLEESGVTSGRRIVAHRFEIMAGDRLGGGETGDVYRGTDTQTGQTVAIKALKPEIMANQPDMVARFVREGQALRQLNHPNIVNVVAAVEEEGQHYLVIEYVEGGSLRDLLEAQGPLSVRRVVEITLELADALARTHHLGIIHRDLKPANVLLAKDGTPRLTDFSHAHVAASPRLTRTGALMGSVGYLSPEVCNGETLDSRADIWALGVMVYEMLTGELPFVGETLVAALNTILAQPVPDLASLRPDVPDALVALVYRMLEKDRHQRIPSMRQVGAELEAILAEERKG